MAKSKSVLDLGIAPSLEDKPRRVLAKQIRDTFSKVDVSFDHRKLSNTLDEMGEEVRTLISDSLGKGFSKIKAEDLLKSVSQYTKAAADSAKEIADLESQLRQEGLSDAQKQHLRNQQEAHAEKMKLVDAEFRSRLKNEKEAYDEFEKTLERARDITGDTAAEFTKKVSQGFNEAADNLIQSLKAGDIAGLLKGLGETGSRAGEGLEARGGVISGADDTHAMGQMILKMGKVVQGLSKAAIFAGVIVGAFATIVKLLIDADSQAKDFNKTLMEGAGAADFVASFGNDLADGLQIARDAAIDFGGNNAFGVTNAEMMDIIRTVNQAGWTYRELTRDVSGAADQTERLREASLTALTYSRLTGMSTQETAEHMAKMVEDFGLTLDGVQDRFSGVLNAAMMSGFGVNRFYSMVMQATSGLAIYNARMEETAGLLLMLGDILGSDLAGEFIQQLQKGFADEGMTERFRRTMLVGTQTMSEIMARSAEDMAHSLVSGLDEGRRNLLASEGFSADPTALIQQLAALSSEERALRMARLRTQDADLARTLQNLADLSEGTNGTLSDVATNLQALDAGGRLAATLALSQERFGRALHELNDDGIQRAAFETMAGISGEQFEQMSRVSEAMYGNWDAIQELIGQIQAAETDRERAVLIDQLADFGVALNDQGQMIAATIDENGEIQRDESGYIIDGFGDYIQSQGDALERTMEEGVAQDVMLAQQVAQNTMSVANILENGVQYVLEQIYGETRIISDLVSRLPGMGGLGRRREVIGNAQSEVAAAREMLQEANELVMLRERQFNSATGVEDRQAAERELNSARSQQQRAQRNVSFRESQLADLQSAFSDTDLARALEGAGEHTAQLLSDVYGGDEQRDQAAQDLVNQQLRQVDHNIERILREGYSVPGSGMAPITDPEELFAQARRDHVLRGMLTEGTNLTMSPASIGDRDGVAVSMGGAQLRAYSGTSTGEVMMDSATANMTESVWDSAYGVLAGDMAANANDTIEAIQDQQVAAEMDLDRREIVQARRDAGYVDDTVSGFDSIFREMDLMVLAQELAKGSNRSAGQIYADLLNGTYDIPGNFQSSSESGRRAMLRIDQGVNDFIYRRDGSITPINRSDELIGYKPGGPVDRASRGGGAPVNIHIHGGDEGRIYNVVNRVLRTAGYGAGKVTSSA